MLTTTGFGAISPVTPRKKIYSTTTVSGREPVVQNAANGRNYDSVSLSGGGSAFFDMVSRLSQDVRTSTTTGDIQALRQQVSNGEYKVDAMSLAARMLLLGEER